MLLNRLLRYCQSSSICLEFRDCICNDFFSSPFPEFYPPQYKKGIIYIRKDTRIRKVDDVINTRENI